MIFKSKIKIYSCHTVGTKLQEDFSSKSLVDHCCSVTGSADEETECWVSESMLDHWDNDEKEVADLDGQGKPEEGWEAKGVLRSAKEVPDQCFVDSHFPRYKGDAKEDFEVADDDVVNEVDGFIDTEIDDASKDVFKAQHPALLLKDSAFSQNRTPKEMIYYFIFLENKIFFKSIYRFRLLLQSLFVVSNYCFTSKERHIQLVREEIIL